MGITFDSVKTDDPNSGTPTNSQKENIYEMMMLQENPFVHYNIKKHNIHYTLQRSSATPHQIF